MGKLYRRDRSPYWWARWQDAQGFTHRESTRTADRRVATLFLSAKEAEAIRESAGYPSAKRITLADAVAQYLDAHAPPIWSEEWHSMQTFFSTLGFPTWKISCHAASV